MTHQKIIFCRKFAIKTFRATVANADIGSPKSLGTFLKKMFISNVSEIRTKSYGPNYAKFRTFWPKNKTKQQQHNNNTTTTTTKQTNKQKTKQNKTKTAFLKPFLTKHWRHFGRRFCGWNYCLMLKYYFEDYHLSVFQKIRHSDT